MRPLVLCLSLCLAGCDDDGGTAAPQDLAVKTGPDLAYDTSCGYPTDQPINSTGVGKFCTDFTTTECNGNGMATTCANLANPKAHLCTFLCSPSDEGKEGPCGTGAICLCMPPIGCGCTPLSCAPRDGGT